MASDFFDISKVSRLIAMGYPHAEIVPLFLPLVKKVANSVAFDGRNHAYEDLVQIGLIKSINIINTFRPESGNLFSYAAMALKHAMWYEVKHRVIDKHRTTDEIDFDTFTSQHDVTHTEGAALTLNQKLYEQIRVEGTSQQASQYVLGVLSSNDYENNRARVIKTLVQGYGVNNKHARFLIDQVMVLLRVSYSKGVKAVRDDRFFENKFQHSLVPELRRLLGERAFEKLIHFFGGLTVVVPSADQIQSIARDLDILKIMSKDWTAGPTLSKKYNISPEGIKAIYTSCLHKLQTDKQYKSLVDKVIPVDSIPGYDMAKTKASSPTALPTFGQRKQPSNRKIANTDSMGFTLGCRNSLIYTMIASGNCNRNQIVKTVMMKFGGKESAAKSTVGAFLSDIKQPFGKFNTSRNLQLLTDAKDHISFEKNSLLEAQKIVLSKRQERLVAEIST